jgi:glutathione S-transferase
MSAADLILYVDPFWVSPYVFNAFTALREKGLDFQTRTIDLKAGEQRRAAYAATSLTARIPALSHHDFMLSESSAIAEYLDEAFPDRPRLFPVNLQDRARARQIMAFLRSDLGPLREERSSETVFYPRTGAALPPLSAAAQAAAQKLMRIAGTLVRPESLTAFGPSWCIADLDLAMMLQRLIRNGEAVPQPLVGYAEAQWQRPSARPFIDRVRAPFEPY